MSWMKRPQGTPGAQPGPDPQPYNQTFGNQQTAYPNYQNTTNPQQLYWQSQPPNYSQHYNQSYEQQNYSNNANQMYQPTHYANQNFANQTYSPTQQGYQHNHYNNQTNQPQNYSQNKTNDAWEDNWDWGWEDSSKQVQTTANQNPVASQTMSQPTQAYNNANIIEESFAPNNTWNWSTEDRKEIKRHPGIPPEQVQELNTKPSEDTPESNLHKDNNSHINLSNHLIQPTTEEVKTLNDRELVKERIPNLALGKRFHLDNLTPQWSIESQMSQESSDGIHTHSESTYRSENQSRNSSSPGPNTDHSNFNYSQSGFDEKGIQNSEWSAVSGDQSTSVDHKQDIEILKSLQEMSITNCENPIPDLLSSGEEQEIKITQDKALSLPPPPISPSSFSTSNSNVPSTSTPSIAMPSTSVSCATLLPAHSSSASLPPPANFPLPSGQNPFKHPGSFSHKSTSKTPLGIPSPNQPHPSQFIGTNLVSPVVVNKMSQQNRAAVGYGVNLETTPDNSERPDQQPQSAFRPIPGVHQVPDNLEVAPKNDRNEYLQTAHLSSGIYGENAEFNHNVPPPGLRRMVVGQHESEYIQNLNTSGDEPPPSFTRMVPGQQNELEIMYNQPSDDYLDRHIDGQPTDNTGRSYRQVDGQQTSNYNQAASNRGPDRRPVGLDRMVPGEPSNIEYSQYQNSNFSGPNEHRVVTGLDHDFSMTSDVGPSEIREQNLDGSDFTEQAPRNPSRNVIGARDISNNASPNYVGSPEDQQREVTMEGENLQDFSVISSTELTFSRDQTLDGAVENATNTSADRKTDASDSVDNPSGSRRQSLNRVNTSGEDSERDKAFKSSPRRDRDKYKSTRDREKDRDGRYSREDRKYDRESDRRGDREDRHSERDRRDRDRNRDRRDRDDIRRHTRSNRRSRYETEDTDYYSDRERDRHYREGSYTSSKPPRPEDRRYRDQRDRTRYNTIERDKRYDERDRPTHSRRGEHNRYRDIDPMRKYGNLRWEREEEERKRVVTFSSDAKTSDRNEGEYSSPTRPDSRDPGPPDDRDVSDPLPGVDSRRRSDRRRPRHVTHDPYYDGYGRDVYGDPYALQRQQYQYYEHLRLTNPAAYMQVYKQLMAGQAPPSLPPDFRAVQHPGVAALYGDGYASLGYDGREERGSVHSGRSSANGLKGTDTELNTDASLNLHLEESTVRSERMTPFKFSTAHIKGSISSRHLVVVRPSYPVDGLPATVQIVSLTAALAADPSVAELTAYPGPLVKGVTHKKSVVEYCESHARNAGTLAPRDNVGYTLVWELLALLLRQNGVVVGTDIAELLMKNAAQHEYKPSAPKNSHTESGRTSQQSESASGAGISGETSGAGGSPRPEQPAAMNENTLVETKISETEALERLRQYLTYGNRQEALEWAMNNNLWGHALQLSWYCERRTRATVATRFLAALPRTDPLHTLYSTLAAKQPPVATCVADERWGDWRPHAAMVLSNSSSKPDQDRRTLIQLGDSLSSRGLLYSAQFCYLSAGVPIARHPLAPHAPSVAEPATPTTPPRLALLLADSRVNQLQQLATNRAIFATEIYEYAMSLNQDYVINELQVYKLMVACRLVDVGLYERALAYTEAAARAVTRAPRDFSPMLITQLVTLADRLKYHDPALHDDPPLVDDTGGDSAEPSPRHHQQWLDDVKNIADALTSQQYPPPPVQEPTEESHEYQQYYQQHQQLPPPNQLEGEGQQYPQYEEWQKSADEQQNYNQYWQQDSPYTGYSEAGAGAEAGVEAEEQRPMITMPGTTASKPAMYGDYDDDRPPSIDQTDRETDTPKTTAKKQDGKSKDESGKADGKGKGGWLGGIFNKLTLRPPNQMILPDDKNPSVSHHTSRSSLRDDNVYTLL